jgi:hypothetical protein
VRSVYSVEDVGEQSVKLHIQTTETSWLRVWGVAMSHGHTGGCGAAAQRSTFTSAHTPQLGAALQ